MSDPIEALIILVGVLAFLAFVYFALLSIKG